MTVYIEHFGLKEEPFSIAPDPRFLYASEQHREALAHLLYGVRDGGGFVLLTGEIGTGKTTVFRCFLEDVPSEVRLALLLHPRLSSRELLAAVCSEFGIAVREEDGTGRLIEGINRFLIEVGASGGRAVIVIDEAQNLSPDILEELRLLTNLETNTRKLLQIVLIGQPELREMLEKPALAQVSQRIVARFHLVPLARKEVAPYVRHRLAIAGKEERIFSPAALSFLFVLTGGVPRLINLVCDRALLGAFAASRTVVSRRLLRRAAEEVMGMKRKGGIQYRPAAAAACLVAAVLLFGGWYLRRSTGGVAAKTGEPTVSASPENPLPGNDSPGTVRPDKEVSSLDWLFQEAGRGSRQEAEVQLLSLWNAEYAAGAGELCNAAVSAGLRCYRGAGALEDLEELDRPALLTLPGMDREVHAVLSRAGKGRTHLLFKGGEGEVDLKWFGTFVILWRPPPGYQGAMLPGRRYTALSWLTAALERAGFGPEEGGGAIYDEKIASAVRGFQAARGIPVDGIAGPVTLIHLNTVVGTDGPRLAGEGV